MKLAVIVTDFAAAANVGGPVETIVKLFDLPTTAANYIAAHRGKWTTVSLALEDEEPEDEP